MYGVKQTAAVASFGTKMALFLAGQSEEKVASPPPPQKPISADEYAVRMQLFLSGGASPRPSLAQEQKLEQKYEQKYEQKSTSEHTHVASKEHTHIELQRRLATTHGSPIVTAAEFTARMFAPESAKLALQAQPHWAPVSTPTASTAAAPVVIAEHAVASVGSAEEYRRRMRLLSETATVFGEKTPRCFPEGAAPGLLTLDRAVSAVGLAFSDVAFVYPTGDADADGNRGAAGFLGAELPDIVANGGRNGSGRTVSVKLMETRHGAGGAVGGALAAGVGVSVFAGSSALRAMTPSLYGIAAQGAPVVFHIAAHSADPERLALGSGLLDVFAVRETGFAILSSNSAQEAQDLALVAHVASSSAAAPFLHVFDGARGLHSAGQVAALPSALLARLASGALERGAASSASVAGLVAASSCPHAAGVVDATMAELEGVFGRRYRLFEYVGPAHPEAAVVVMGAAATAALEAAVLGEGGGKVGLLKVRLLRPWSPAHFLAALPASVRRVCVLEQTAAPKAAGGAATAGALFADVAVAFHTGDNAAGAWASRPAPLLLSGAVAEDGVLGAHEAADVVANLASASPRTGFVVGSTTPPSPSSGLAPPPGPTAPAVPAATKQLITWSGSDKESGVYLLARVLGGNDGLGLAVDAVSATDPLAVTASSSPRDLVKCASASKTELRFGPKALRHGAASLPIEAADLVAVGRAHLHEGESNLDLLSRLRANASAVLIDAPSADALPASLRKDIAHRGASLFLIDTHAALKPAPAAALAELADVLLHAAGLEIVSPGDARAGRKSLVLAARAAAGERGWCADAAGALESALSRLSTLVREVPYNARAWIAEEVGEDQEEAVVVLRAHRREFFPLSSVGPASPAKSGGGSARKSARRGRRDAGAARPQHELVRSFVFREAYGSAEELRPSVTDQVHRVRLTESRRLTPDDYHRNIFHLEFDISDTSLTYKIGDALGVYGHNSQAEVDAFLAARNSQLDGAAGHPLLEPTALVALPARGNMAKGTQELVSLRNLLVQHLDLFGRPSKKFYYALSKHCDSQYESLKLAHIGTDDTELFKLGLQETVTYADVLLQYKSARLSPGLLAKLVPTIKPRHYSIASSMKLNPKSVHLLVVAVEWKSPAGKARTGQCTRYLANLKLGAEVTVDIVPSVLKMPPSHKQPIVMAGLGTGMAPFRAFIQERKYQREQGLDVGPVVLYFGARHRHQEYLYGAELEDYKQEGVVSHLGLAFSRDQDDKVYIQHKIEEDATMLNDLLVKQKGHFYLCGPTWPVPDVRDALAKGMSPMKAARGEVDTAAVEALKAKGRYVLEVY